MFISVFVRRLGPSKTCDDFIAAWYPDKGLGFPGRGPIVARNIDDDRAIYEVEDEFDFSTDDTVARGRR